MALNRVGRGHPARHAPGAPERAPGGAGFSFDEVLANSIDPLMNDTFERMRPAAHRIAARLMTDPG